MVAGRLQFVADNIVLQRKGVEKKMLVYKKSDISK